MSEMQYEPGASPSPNGDLIISERPKLRRPIMLVAFEGWNDAAEGASSALEFLQDTWDSVPFAEIDAEEFYDFTEVRPMVRVDDNNERKIDWPANEFDAGSVQTIVSTTTPGGTRLLAAGADSRRTAYAHAR